MDKTSRARLLDTLRKRRARKRERALNEGKPEDFYFTEADFIEYYESGGQDAAPASGRAGTPRQQTAPVPTDEPEPADEYEYGGLLFAFLGDGFPFNWQGFVCLLIFIGACILFCWRSQRHERN